MLRGGSPSKIKFAVLSDLGGLSGSKNVAVIWQPTADGLGRESITRQGTCPNSYLLFLVTLVFLVVQKKGVPGPLFT